MMPAIENRRTDLRVDVPLVIRFRRNTLDAQTPWDLSLVRNISKSGIFFNSTFRFQEGDELEIKLHNPHSKNVDHCTAMVIRSIPTHEPSVYCETAVKIKEIFNDNLRDFYRFIDNSLTNR